MHGKDLAAIKEEMGKYEGGSIDLDLDEQTGIAVMTINNPRTRNALTGTVLCSVIQNLK